MRIKKHIDDFKKWGWPGVITKIRNRIMAPTFKHQTHKLEYICTKENKKSILILNGAG